MPNTDFLSVEQKAEFFDLIADTLNIGFSIMDEDLKYQFINQQTYKQLGATPDNLKIGDTLFDAYNLAETSNLFTDNNLVVTKLRRAAQEIKAGEKGYETSDLLQLANGKTHKVYRVKHESGFTVAMSHDVSELLEKEHLLEKALSLGKAGYWILNLKTKALELSHSSHDYFGPEVMALIQKNGIMAGVREDHRAHFQAAIKNAPNTNDKFDIRCCALSKSPKAKWNRTTGRIIRDAQGHPIEIRAFVIDISSEVRQAERLKKTKDAAIAASIAKSEFLANMSHEIRTPMNGVLGMAELLDQSEITERQRDYVKVITRSSEALLTIINDILDFSKIEAGAFELNPVPFNLRDSIEDVMALLAVKAQEKGLELIINYPSNMPRGFIGDAGRIRQIITNLIGNAIKFTNDGYVMLAVNAHEQDTGKTKISISVEDTGIGIDAKKIETIFDKFTQADGSTTRVYGGTGLGLAISRKIVNLMDGDITVKSTPNKGSTFYFDLYLPADRNLDTIIKHSDDLNGKRVLIIDDIDINRNILSERLHNWGMETLCVEDGIKAMVALDDAAKTGKPFDLILLDYLMPGMNGMELAQLIKSNQKLAHIPTLMLSSVCQNISTAQLKELNISTYMVKPVREQQLFAGITKTLAERVATPTVTPPFTPINTAPARVNPSVPSGPAPTPYETLDASNQQTIETLNEIEAVIESVTNRAALEMTDGASNITAAPVMGHNQKINILVAEDFPLNQEVVGLMLQDTQFEPTFTNNGQLAVEEFKANPDKYAAVLMDISMPVMDGYEAAELIKSIKKTPSDQSVPIIALTGHALKHDREKCLDSNMDDYLTKPVKQGELLLALERWTSSVDERSALAG